MKLLILGGSAFLGRHLVEAGQIGVYNATGPDYTLTMGQMLAECRAVSGSDARLVWMSEPFLLEKGVGPWMGVPLWLPVETDTRYRGFMTRDCRKAFAAGLAFRPLADAIRETLAWDTARMEPLAQGIGLTPEREAELLKEWWERQG